MCLFIDLEDPLLRKKTSRKLKYHRILKRNSCYWVILLFSKFYTVFPIENVVRRRVAGSFEYYLKIGWIVWKMKPNHNWGKSLFRKWAPICFHFRFKKYVKQDFDLMNCFYSLLGYLESYDSSIAWHWIGL